ncbi:MAG: ATP-binding protein [Marmoricola sp.]
MGTPRPAMPLVGRESELGFISDLLRDDDNAVVTVTGPAGVGKTALAVEVARRVEPAFPGGVLYVPLADLRDPDLIPSAVLSALGAPDLGGRDPVTALAELIGESRTLVVLDNLEHLLPVAPGRVVALVEACPRIAVLVTSRHPVGLTIEKCLPLAPLSGLDAVEFLVNRVRAIDPASDWPEHPDQLAEVCERLDGLPLALSLIASRARALSPSAIIEALDTRLPLLTGGGADLPERQRTMSTAIAWSYNELDDAPATLLRRFGVCVGGADLHTVFALVEDLDWSEAECLAALETLLTSSLVERGVDGRFQMLEVIREYALDELTRRSEVDQAVEAHLHHFLNVSEEWARETGGPEQHAALDRMARDAPNVTAAIRRAIERGESVVAARLCIALRFLWYVRGPLVEGQAFFAATLALPGIEPRVRARAFIEAAALARHSGQWVGAATLTRRAVSIAREHGEPSLIATALLQDGFVQHLRGQFEDARASLTEALQIRREGGDVLGEARALLHLGLVAQFGDGDAAAALDLQKQAHALFLQVGNQRHIAISLVLEIDLTRELGNLSESRRLVAAAHQAIAELQDQPLQAHALYVTASLLADENHYSQACRVLGAARNLERICGASVWPVVSAGVERWRPAVVAALGRPRVEALERQGAGLAIDDIATASSDDLLTRREREIATLVAQGMTNRAIADELVISARTVDGHLGRIIAKLACGSRAGIAAWITANPAD